MSINGGLGECKKIVKREYEGILYVPGRKK
jgi:hypothetical protein